MKEGQYSRTAVGAAALRASHALFSKDPIFDDFYAYSLTSETWQKILNQPYILKILNSQLSQKYLGLLVAQVLGRARYAEDTLKKAYEQGCRQYVIVGAGLDSFIMREAKNYPELEVFELDHPATQVEKQRKLNQIGSIPNNVHFVPVNFETQSVAEALAKSSFSSEQYAFVSWLGTTHYLEQETILMTLKSIITCVANGSEIVLDYSINYNDLRGFERFGAILLSHFTRSLSEPLIGSFTKSTLHKLVQEIGYSVIEDLSGDELNERYFIQHKGGMKHTNATHMLHLKKSKLKPLNLKQ